MNLIYYDILKLLPVTANMHAYAKFWSDKQRALWYVMVFLEWSIRRRSIVGTVSATLQATL